MTSHRLLWPLFGLLLIIFRIGAHLQPFVCHHAKINNCNYCAKLYHCAQCVLDVDNCCLPPRNFLENNGQPGEFALRVMEKICSKPMLMKSEPVLNLCRKQSEPWIAQNNHLASHLADDEEVQQMFQEEMNHNGFQLSEDPFSASLPGINLSVSQSDATFATQSIVPAAAANGPAVMTTTRTAETISPRFRPVTTSNPIVSTTTSPIYTIAFSKTSSKATTSEAMKMTIPSTRIPKASANADDIASEAVDETTEMSTEFETTNELGNLDVILTTLQEESISTSATVTEESASTLGGIEEGSTTNSGLSIVASVGSVQDEAITTDVVLEDASTTISLIMTPIVGFLSSTPSQVSTENFQQQQTSSEVPMSSTTQNGLVMMTSQSAEIKVTPQEIGIASLRSNGVGIQSASDDGEAVTQQISEIMTTLDGSSETPSMEEDQSTLGIGTTLDGSSETTSMEEGQSSMTTDSNMTTLDGSSNTDGSNSAPDFMLTTKSVVASKTESVSLACANLCPKSKSMHRCVQCFMDHHLCCWGMDTGLEAKELDQYVLAKSLCVL